MSNEISHYGMPRRSGRYEWGSGDNPQQRAKSFLGRADELAKQGLSEKEIAEGLGLNVSQLRAKRSLAKAEKRKMDTAQVVRLKDKGYSNVEIGKHMGINESSVRALLNPVLQQRSEATNATANMLKDNVEKKGYIDVGIGVERHMNVSRTKLKTALSQLEEEGYLISYVPVEQLGTGKKTSVMVLSKPHKQETVDIIKLRNKGYSDADISKKMDIDESAINSLLKESYADIYKNQHKIKTVTDYSEDGGVSFLGLEPIRSVDSKRVHIRYDEDGGTDKDGLIELRRGVSDISLGNANYAQVRIGVDGSHYMKGMAVYSDDLPKGVDMIYNTNKKLGTPKEKVFKEMKVDQDGNIDSDNPFGATVRQRHYIDDKGNKQLSSVNIVNEEGEWRDKWSKSLSSQMLSKQTPALAKKQLDIAYNIKKEEFDEIMALTNPTVRKKLLDSFASDCDSSAVHLKAAALPRSGWHALIPFPTMKENEVYAPNFRDGEKVVLIRYPHGGIFEIPELTVNNKHKPAKETLKQAKDAIGIHPKVAEKLSGADFDGDACLVIPNNNKDIKHSASLKGLKDFDPKALYKLPDSAPRIDARTKGIKMGDVSNLITDMTIKGALPDDIAKAVRHSMVVIDSEKHHLDYKQSYIDHGIAQLKKKYQGSSTSGASTLISKASSETRVGVRKEKTNVKNMTEQELKDYKAGKKVYEYTNETYTKRTILKDGTVKEKVMPRTIKSTKMAEEEDAFKLSSGTPIESIYATHANKLKSLANQSRKEYINTPSLVSNPAAKEKYKKEVDSLNAALNIALKNAPLERQALILANSTVATKKAANPNMDNDGIKKVKGQALAAARVKTGAKKQRIDITDKQWEAIQAGAISNNKLSQILNNTDIDRIKALATPRTTTTITPAKVRRAEALLASGNTQADVADALGISTSTLAKILN